MKPDTSSPGGGVPNRDVPQAPVPAQDQVAATNVIRSQISSLYGDNPVVAAQQYEEAPNPYARTHVANPKPEAEQWKEYHSAWQAYYQQYYQGYYGQQAATQTAQPAQDGYFTTQPEAPEQPENITKDEALTELRQKLLGRVQESAKKVRKSRHFVPIAAALVVVLVFVFLQYNRTIFATVNAYVSPGAINPQNIVIDPSGDTVVGPEPKLIIPKINVDVPAVYGVGNDHNSQMAAMEKGVAHFAIPGASSHPGEIGNTVLSGHSSNDLFDPGSYKFIFAQLEKLTIGDTIYANYEGKRYTYVVTKTEVVAPTEVSKLVYPTDKPMLTLITCTPLGTALNRLLVTAEQVSPDPASAQAAPTTDTGSAEAAIPGSSPTFLERLFGAN